MANEAHKEPTMEEILASIRKIISDDAAAPASAPEPEPEIANDEEDDVSLEEVMFDDDIREEATEPEAAEEFEMESFEIEDFSAEEPPEAAPEPAQSFESLLSASRAAEAEPEPAPQPVPEPVAAAPAPAQPKPAPAPAPVEKPMSASPAYDNASLTDESTANAAAGALGKLISKMDLGTDNTLEGLVRELLRPMIKEWLDANLASIVEEKVEAEVERISRMAR
ncbi:PopZ family protein [Hyphomonas jannaschiana]|uniref:PopZ family protein n=1 Tax=Hyphomonas jannaschiana TaxID=86 RepID=UPI0035C67CC4